MKSFSNFSNPDLRLLWAGMVSFKMLFELAPFDFPPSINLSELADMKEDINDRIKILQRVNELLHAIEEEMPDLKQVEIPAFKKDPE